MSLPIIMLFVGLFLGYLVAIVWFKRNKSKAKDDNNDLFLPSRIYTITKRDGDEIILEASNSVAEGGFLYFLGGDGEDLLVVPANDVHKVIAKDRNPE